MNSVRSLMMLSALVIAAPALAQKMDGQMNGSKMPMAKMPVTKMSGSKMSGTKMMDPKMPEQKMSGMMGAPMLKYTTMSGMNMMMSGNTVEFTKAPGYKLVSYSYNMHSATLIYQSTNANGLFNFYNKAIMGEGWKEDMNMKMGMMKTGEYGEAYVSKNWKLDLMTMNQGSRTTVTLRTH